MVLCLARLHSVDPLYLHSLAIFWLNRTKQAQNLMGVCSTAHATAQPHFRTLPKRHTTSPILRFRMATHARSQKAAILCLQCLSWQPWRSQNKVYARKQDKSFDTCFLSWICNFIKQVHKLTWFHHGFAGEIAMYKEPANFHQLPMEAKPAKLRIPRTSMWRWGKPLPVACWCESKGMPIDSSWCLMILMYVRSHDHHLRPGQAV